jgi:hypothetical protein
LEENKNELKQRSERLNLFWVCRKTGRKQPAGVAFFNEDQGDYRLKIDILPEDKTLFLKAISSGEDVTYYRIEAAVKKAGRVVHRAEVGSGYAKKGDSVIYMDIGPFSRTLVLEQQQA